MRGSKTESGFTLIEALVVTGIFGIVLAAVLAMHQSQLKTNNYLLFNSRRTELQSALSGQFLSVPDNCGCLFKNAGVSEFSASASGSDLVFATPPTSIGRFRFTTPGDCATATMPQPLVDTTGIDGLRLVSVGITNLLSAAGGISGKLTMAIESTKEVLGPRRLNISIPVAISTSAGSAPGMVKFEGCSMGRTMSDDRIVAIGKTNMVGNGNVICAPISFTPPSNPAASGIMGSLYYPTGGSHGWGAWSVFFENFDPIAGTALVCIDSGGWSGGVASEWVMWQVVQM